LLSVGRLARLYTVSVGPSIKAFYYTSISQFLYRGLVLYLLSVGPSIEAGTLFHTRRVRFLLLSVASRIRIHTVAVSPLSFRSDSSYDTRFQSVGPSVEALTVSPFPLQDRMRGLDSPLVGKRGDAYRCFTRDIYPCCLPTWGYEGLSHSFFTKPSNQVTESSNYVRELVTTVQLSNAICTTLFT